MQKLKITPVSMAAAIDLGIPEINRPKTGHSPVSVSNSPQTRNAPVICSNECPKDPAEINRAAPGVLQTIEIGIRYR